MTDCPNVRMRESLPEYMHGLLELRQRLVVQAHLASCDACAAELAVLERCRSALAVVPAVDTRRVIAALPAPPGAGRRGDRADRSAAARTLPLRSGWNGGGRRIDWRVAAAALLMVGAVSVAIGRGGHWPVTDGPMGSGSGVASTPFALPAGGGRSGDSMVVAAAGGRVDAAGNLTGNAASLSLAGGLSDLSDDALTALLGEVEAMEALPLEEPPPVDPFLVADQAGDL